MIVTDLDGTLFSLDGELSERNFQTLNLLKTKKVLRVIATGRSLYSAKKVLSKDFPLDMLIFSSGAGIYDWIAEELICQKSLDASQVKEISDFLLEMKLDFMIHHPVPDNHRFDYFNISESNVDFMNRVNVYFEDAFLQKFKRFVFKPASQLLVVVPYMSETLNLRGLDTYNIIKDELKDYSVIRTTSPLNHRDIWIEIFPKGVDKASGVKFLQEYFNIENNLTACIGNDYNDIDMLNHTPNAYVVANAPKDLKDKFYVVSDCREHGFSEAVEHFLTNIRTINKM
ncbi:MAG: HAD family hydrolase [Candidatus Cloacimonetes bacterium]|nr:HAD family hydrolase [Candidatus Cloacimonadota bacterium]